jgi:hypothetical protein
LRQRHEEKRKKSPGETTEEGAIEWNASRALGKKLDDDDDSFFLFLKMIGLGASFPLTPSST